MLCRVLISGLLLCLTAPATILTTSIYYPNAPVGSGLYQPDWGFNGFDGPDGTIYISVPKFDSSLGTLNSVTFTLGGHVQGTYDVTSAAGSPGTFTITAEVILVLTQPDFTQLVLTTPTVSIAPTLNPGENVTGTLNDDQEETGSAFTAQAFLDLFTGTGTIDLPVAAVGNSSITSPGVTPGSGISSLASAYAFVAYDYTPDLETPEPAWTGAVGGILLLAGGMRRRRLKSSAGR